MHKLKLPIILLNLKDQIFKINSDQEFNQLALEIFNYQYSNNPVYQEFCNHLNIIPTQVKTISQIPFLPVEFFKTHKIITGDYNISPV